MATFSVRQKMPFFSCIYNPQVTVSPISSFTASFNGNRVKNHPWPWTCLLSVPTGVRHADEVERTRWNQEHESPEAWPLATCWLTDDFQPISACVQTHLLRQARGLSKNHCNINKAGARAIFGRKDEEDEEEEIKRFGSVQFEACMSSKTLYVVCSACLSRQRRSSMPGTDQTACRQKYSLWKICHQT